jgi:hypothetical protein
MRQIMSQPVVSLYLFDALRWVYFLQINKLIYSPISKGVILTLKISSYVY